MPDPLISVVLPTFNRMAWLPEAVASVQAQTCGDWELIVVDDGSTDGTGAWVANLHDDRIRYCGRPHVGRIAAVRNAGLDMARGAWTAFLDSDDRWAPAKLARQLERLAARPDCRWCYGAFETIDRDGVAVAQPSGGPWRPFEGWILRPLLTTEAAVTVQTLVVETRLMNALRFDERLPLAEDYDLALCLAAASPACVVDEVLAAIRMHEGRTTASAGPYDGHVGKALAYRKAYGRASDPGLKRLARRQLAVHAGVLARRAVRRGDVRQLLRTAGILLGIA